MYGTSDIRLPDVKEPRMGLHCLQAAAGLKSHTSFHNSSLPGEGLRCLPDLSMSILAVQTAISRVRYCVDMSCPACSFGHKELDRTHPAQETSCCLPAAATCWIDRDSPRGAATRRPRPCEGGLPGLGPCPASDAVWLYK